MNLRKLQTMAAITALTFACSVFPATCLAQITVGPTTIISADAPNDPHGESFFAVNPKNSNDQIAASCRISDKGAG